MGSQAMVDGTYEEFYASLDTSCNDESSITGAAAILEFTPDENTPDLLYYQCVTHRNLGWEIRVVDPKGDDMVTVERDGGENKEEEQGTEAELEESPAASTPNMRGSDLSSTSGAKTAFNFGLAVVLGAVGLWMI